MRLVLRHAWLNLWDKHMTTGRINQVSRLNNREHQRKPRRLNAGPELQSKYTEQVGVKIFSAGADSQQTIFLSVRVKSVKNTSFNHTESEATTETIWYRWIAAYKTPFGASRPPTLWIEENTFRVSYAESAVCSATRPGYKLVTSSTGRLPRTRTAPKDSNCPALHCALRERKKKNQGVGNPRTQIIFKFSPIYRFLPFWSSCKIANKTEEWNKRRLRKSNTCTPISKILKLEHSQIFEHFEKY